MAPFGSNDLQFVGGKEWKVGKNTTFGFSVKYGNQGGRYFIPIDMAASSIKKEAVYVDNQAYSAKQQNYSRLDIKLTCALNMKRIRQEWSLDLQNVFNT